MDRWQCVGQLRKLGEVKADIEYDIWLANLRGDYEYANSLERELVHIKSEISRVHELYKKEKEYS